MIGIAMRRWLKEQQYVLAFSSHEVRRHHNNEKRHHRRDIAQRE
jgi:hypothetical protein